MRIEIRGDYASGGWFLDYVGADPLPFMTFYTGPFASRADAQRALPEYEKAVRRVLDA